MSDQRSASSPVSDDLDDGSTRRRLGPTSYLLIGLLIGLLAAIVLLWVLRGNPFSAANEVVYSQVVVGSVADDADRICWAEDPDRRDSPQTCAILALDPEIDVPESGDLVTIGLVDFHTPGGDEFSQVVHVAPATLEADADGTEPATPGEDPTPTETATPGA